MHLKKTHNFNFFKISLKNIIPIITDYDYFIIVQKMLLINTSAHKSRTSKFLLIVTLFRVSENVSMSQITGNSLVCLGLSEKQGRLGRKCFYPNHILEAVCRFLCHKNMHLASLL